MPGSAAALLHLDLEGREIELVVEDGDVGGREPVEAHRFADRLAAFVHEGRGLQEKEFLGAQPCLDRPAGEALFGRFEPVDLGARVDRHEADRSDANTSEPQSLMRPSNSSFCLKNKTQTINI